MYIGIGLAYRGTYIVRDVGASTDPTSYATHQRWSYTAKMKAIICISNK